jgi:hypothetical protein
VNEQERAAFRAFVRDNHPDRGGDPEVFVAGLARFDAARADDPPDSDGRYDAPIDVVRPLPFPLRVAIAVLRTVRHQRNRRVQ